MEINKLKAAIKAIKRNLINPLSDSMVTENGKLDSKSFSIAGGPLLANKAEECKNSFDTILERCTILKKY